MKRENFIELPLKQILLKKIQAYISTVWATKVDQNKLNNWLSNFKNEDEIYEQKEQLHMLYLLSKYSFLGDKEIRVLLKALFRDLYKRPIIEKIRRENNDTLNSEIITREFKKEFDSTKFVSVGGVSESGSLLMYPFRQENSIPEPNLIIQKDVFRRLEYGGDTVDIVINNTDIKRYVFIDDFIGSGEQGKEKLKDDIKLLKEKNPDLEINYYVLVATEDGINTIKKLNLFNSVEAVFILDDSFKTFDTNSRYYKNCPIEIDKEFSKETAIKYGSMLLPRQELGFGDCQLLFSFYHNTPDNTLPIIWSEENSWNYIFKRFHKIK